MAATQRPHRTRAATDERVKIKPSNFDVRLPEAVADVLLSSPYLLSVAFTFLPRWERWCVLAAATKGWRGVLDQSGDRKALRDPDKAWGRLIDQGVSIVQTDYPAALLDYLEDRGLRGHVPTSIAVADGGSSAPAPLGATSRSR